MDSHAGRGEVVRVVCTSDTHNLHAMVFPPPGDLFIHAGDMTRSGTLAELADFNDWLGALPHRHKVVIAGNHDFCFEKQGAEARAVLSNALYLEDEGAEVAGLRIYGSPWQPAFHDWTFNLERGAALREKWSRIPAGLDILITHGPPFGRGDETLRGERVGCEDLAAAVARLRPRLHIFGHIHEGYGRSCDAHTTYINASFVDWEYDFGNDAQVVDLAPRGSEDRGAP